MSNATQKLKVICPTCSQVTHFITNAKGENVSAGPGAPALCEGCGSISIFDGKGQLRRPDPVEELMFVLKGYYEEADRHRRAGMAANAVMYICLMRAALTGYMARDLEKYRKAIKDPEAELDPEVLIEALHQTVRRFERACFGLELPSDDEILEEPA